MQRIEKSAALLAQGIAKYKQANSDALQDFEKVIELDPDCAVAHLHRGLIYRNIGQNENALVEFGKVIALRLNASDYIRSLSKQNPALPGDLMDGRILAEMALVFRGNVYGSLDQEADAISDYVTANKINPVQANGIALRHHAMLLHKKGKVEQALTLLDLSIYYFENVIQKEFRSHQDQGAYYYRAFIYFHGGALNAAREGFFASIAYHYKPASSYYFLGHIFLQQGKASEAEEFFLKGLALEDNSSPSYTYLGHARLKQGKAVEALADFTRAIEINPTQANGYLHRGIALLSLLREKEAERDFLTVIRMDSASPVVRLYTYAQQLKIPRDVAEQQVLKQAILDLATKTRLEGSTIEDRCMFALALSAAGEVGLSMQEFYTVFRNNLPDAIPEHMQQAVVAMLLNNECWHVRESNSPLPLSGDYVKDRKECWLRIILHCNDSEVRVNALMQSLCLSTAIGSIMHKARGVKLPGMSKASINAGTLADAAKALNGVGIALESITLHKSTKMALKNELKNNADFAKYLAKKEFSALYSLLEDLFPACLSSKMDPRLFGGSFSLDKLERKKEDALLREDDDFVLLDSNHKPT